MALDEGLQRGLSSIRERRAQATAKGSRSCRRILDAAREALEGGDATSITVPQIAKLAGVSKGAVYYYFEDIDQVVQEVVSEGLEELVGSFEQAAITARSAQESMTRITDAFAEALTQNASVLRFLLDKLHVVGSVAEEMGGEQAMRARILALISAQLERGKAEGVVRPDVDSEMSAAAILGVYLAMAVRWLSSPEHDADPQELKSAIGSFVSFGVSATPAAPIASASPTSSFSTFRCPV